LLGYELSHLLYELIRREWLPQGGYVIEQAVRIGHRLTDMQYRQSRSLAADRLDQLSVRNHAPTGIGD
jgi:hypothetical protein